MLRPALAVAAVLLAGCSASSPKFTLAGAAPAERTEQGVAMLITLDAKNDNDVALPLRDVRYTVELDGRKVFSGTRSAEATLRRLGTQQIVLPAVINLGAAPAVRTSGKVPYRISGTVTYVTPGQIAEILFDNDVRIPTVGFSGAGEVDLTGGTP